MADRDAFFQLIATIKMFPKAMRWFCLLGVCEVLPQFGLMYLSQMVIDRLGGDQPKNDLLKLIVVGICLISISMSFILLLRQKVELTKADAAVRLNERVAFSQLALPLAEIESIERQSLKNDLDQITMRTGGVSTLLNLLGEVTTKTLLVVLAGINLVFVFIEQSRGSHVTSHNIMIILLLIVSGFGLSRRVVALQGEQSLKINKLNQEINRANGGAFAFMQLISDHEFGKEIRLFHLSEFLCDKLNTLWGSSMGKNLMKRLSKEKTRLSQELNIFETISTGTFLILLMEIGRRGDLTTGFAVLCFSNIVVLYKATIDLIFGLSAIQNNISFIETVQQLIGVETKSVHEKKDPLMSGPYVIRFQEVFFKYPGNNEWALENVSFVLHPGEKVAFVGENGSGKTTAIKLLCRLYEPQRGRVMINDVDVRLIDHDQYLNILSVIFQDFSLNAFRLSTNITGTEDYDQTIYKDVLEKANLQELPLSGGDPFLFSLFEENGIELSGGERQKIAIARAIYRPHEILILDEPTSALDAKAEQETFQLFSELASGRTTLFISHRLSSCTFCDNIFVFAEGRILQQGNHPQLVKQTGKYQELWQTQAGLYNSSL